MVEIPRSIPSFDTIIGALRHHARVRPDDLAFATSEDRCTFAELERDADTLARSLRAAGLSRGGRCLLVFPNGLPVIRLIFATQIAGGTPVLASPAIPSDLIVRRLSRLDCDLAVFDADIEKPEGDGLPLILTFPELENGPESDEVLTSPRSDDIAFLQLTSGTTGEPKAAMVLQRNLMAYMSIAIPSRFGVDDVFVCWVPLFHDLGIVQFVMIPLYLGNPCHLVETGIGTLRRWLETIADVRGTVTGAPDFVYRIAAHRISPEGLNLDSLRFATNGGEPVKPKTIDTFQEKFGIRNVIMPGYGMAETTLGISSHDPRQPRRIGPNGTIDCGRPFPTVEVRTVDQNGSFLERGQIGELTVRGPNVFAGYFRDEAATREVLVDGWLRTGDEGMIDDDGYVFVLGRKRAMIKRAGSTIAPREIEEIAERVEGVRSAAAVGLPSTGLFGADRVIVVAEVARLESPDELIMRIANDIRTSIGFLPEDVRLVPPRTIPRTANGKIRYEELRNMVSSDG